MPNSLKEGINMKQDELELYHECSFDAFCKKAIRNLAVDAKRLYWKKTMTTSDEELLMKCLTAEVRIGSPSNFLMKAA